MAVERMYIVTVICMTIIIVAALNGGQGTGKGGMG